MPFHDHDFIVRIEVALGRIPGTIRESCAILVETEQLRAIGRSRRLLKPPEQSRDTATGPLHTRTCNHFGIP